MISNDEIRRNIFFSTPWLNLCQFPLNIIRRLQIYAHNILCESNYTKNGKVLVWLKFVLRSAIDFTVDEIEIGRTSNFIGAFIKRV